MTALSGFAASFLLMFIAGRVNRSDRHPFISSMLWAVAVTVFVWAALIWRAS
jgi:hypothetical protein